MTTARRDSGQASVELALTLPLLTVLLLGLVQAALVARDAVLVVHAAREAARAASVDPRPAVARSGAQAAGSLEASRLYVELRTGDGSAHVKLRYQAPTDVPLVGALVPDVGLHSSVTMRLERPN